MSGTKSIRYPYNRNGLCALGFMDGLGYFNDVLMRKKSRDPAWKWLSSAFTYTSMVNYPTEADFMMHIPAFPVTEEQQRSAGLSLLQVFTTTIQKQRNAAWKVIKILMALIMVGTGRRAQR
ncbi:hypothetical protein SAY86_010060 [Trapa natans]|uniref:Uncharacterized protein n=1 Tax=Trapa natans TaxID=22666 RepID=A0AAN7KY01_TRANT|nr:hypothetical protein SAY86_010060 [Trapa natans]